MKLAFYVMQKMYRRKTVITYVTEAQGCWYDTSAGWGHLFPTERREEVKRYVSEAQDSWNTTHAARSQW